MFLGSTIMQTRASEIEGEEYIVYTSRIIVPAARILAGAVLQSVAFAEVRAAAGCIAALQSVAIVQERTEAVWVPTACRCIVKMLMQAQSKL
jgi:hypothetical protein